jgi:GPH family glycoside/pentoside/hexuronide:cation symporter
MSIETREESAADGPGAQGAVGRRRQSLGDETTLSTQSKVLLGMGDHTLNLTLTALSVLYVFYLTEHIGLRPALAGSVLLIGRFVDAITDPLMGRISDRTRTRMGRRRPYFLLGAVPFAFSFGLLWVDIGLQSQAAMFAFYAGVYILYSLCATVITVPYLAVLPEVAPTYDERNSLNAYRAALAITGTLVGGAAFRPLAQYFGGGSDGFEAAALAAGAWLVWPWFAICLSVRERPPPARHVQGGFAQALRTLATHRSYRLITGLYLSGRIAMDLIGMILVFYFAYWLRRPGDFEIMFVLFLVTAAASLPIWMRIAPHVDKRTLFIAGSCWWGLSQLTLFAITPEWPRLLVLVLPTMAAAGYAIVDMMPWSMLADVVDEDELRTGERREGLYSGVFGFLRKLAGALGVWIAGLVLDAAGFVPGAEQSETTLWAIRGLTAVAPALFLAIGAWIASKYSLGREQHAEILLQLQERHAQERRT